MRLKKFTPERQERFLAAMASVTARANEAAANFSRLSVRFQRLRASAEACRRFHFAQQERPKTVCDDCLRFIDVDLVYKSLQHPGRLICEGCFHVAEAAGGARLEG